MNALKRNTETAATPIAFVQAIVAAYKRYGKSPQEALHQAHILPNMLATSTARITALQMEIVSGQAMRELDDEALGWFSRRLPWGTYGMLARASIGSANLGLALKRWCRHHGLITDDVALTITIAGDLATLTIIEKRDLGHCREFCLVSLLRNFHGFACWLIDSRIPMLGVRFTFPSPPHCDAYDFLFPGLVAFDATSTSMQFDARYLNLALRRDESALQLMLQRALPLTVHHYRRDRLLVQRVRQALATNPNQIQTAETLSFLLNVAPRTLHRQLKEEGASLQDLKDEVRKRKALHLLLRTSQPLKQVAHASGFKNEKSFIRAFSHWTGTPPSAYRNQERSLA